MSMLVSVGVPIYKSVFLKQALESLINQSYKNLEIILVNDCSPFEVKPIVNSFSDSRIKYFENPKNVGGSNLVFVWNQCLQIATGEVFILFSDDDIYDPFFIEKMVILVEKNLDVDVFRARVEVIDEENRIKEIAKEVPFKESYLDYLLGRLKSERQHYMPDLVFRRKVLIEKGGFINFPLAWYSDEATCLNLCLGKSIITTNEVLVKWRFSEINISSKGSFLQRIEAAYEFHHWLIQKLISYGIDEKVIKIVNEHSLCRIELNKRNMLIRTANRDFFAGVFSIIQNSMIVRENYEFKLKNIIRTVLSFIKLYMRKKN